MCGSTRANRVFLLHGGNETKKQNKEIQTDTGTGAACSPSGRGAACSPFRKDKVTAKILITDGRKFLISPETGHKAKFRKETGVRKKKVENLISPEIVCVLLLPKYV